MRLKIHELCKMHGNDTKLDSECGIRRANAASGERMLVATLPTNDMICHLPFEPRFFGVGFTRNDKFIFDVLLNTRLSVQLRPINQPISYLPKRIRKIQAGQSFAGLSTPIAKGLIRHPKL
jgi:hypothetical protein